MLLVAAIFKLSAFLRDKKKEAARKEKDNDADDQEDEEVKKRKKAGLDEEGEDIDEDTELMYLQALEETGDGGDSQPEEEDVKMTQAPMTPMQQMPMPFAGSSAKKRQLSPATLSVPGSLVEQPKKAARPKKAASSVPSVPASPAPSSVSLPAPLAPVAPVASSVQHKPAAADTGEQASRQTWSKCKVFDAAEFGGTKPGQPLAVPSKYTKDTQVAKWDGEVTKVRPFIATIERLLASEGCKVKDTEVKNAIKSFQKINSKVDKRLEYEAANSTAEEPALSQRIAALKETLDALKSLKELAVSAGKSGSISEATLKTSIDRVNTAVQKLIQGRWTGFPLFWVQAQLGVTVYNVKSCLSCVLLLPSNTVRVRETLHKA